MSKGHGRRPTFVQHVQKCAVVGHTEPNARGRCWRCDAVLPLETVVTTERQPVDFSTWRGLSEAPG